ncbi:IclR family transcriptional regulator [Subtercola sp. YIM 133946]|uniref:IclR family transcriptional regulator n=1 Tax=Subtercola sp. YIM 133946 TaxID=3118909 RepID=UPI002F92365A
MAHRSGGTTVLQRHLMVLDAFDVLHPELTLTEIATAAGLAPSSAHRLTSELVREGLLERGHDRTFRLGVRLWEYASRTPGALGLREVARPWLGAVHNHVRQHAQLGVQSGADVVFIERMSASDAVINATLIGGRIPLHASACGLVLLADAPPAVWRQLSERGLRRYTPQTIGSIEQLEGVISQVRAEGFAETPGHIHPDSRGIAVPVRGPEGAVVAGIGVVVANDATSPQPAVELLTVASAAISRALAHGNPFTYGHYLSQ